MRSIPMNDKEIKKMLSQIEYENRRRELRKEFVERGVRFYEKEGWGFIKNGVKHYEEKY